MDEIILHILARNPDGNVTSYRDVAHLLSFLDDAACYCDSLHTTNLPAVALIVKASQQVMRDYLAVGEQEHVNWAFGGE
jgi:alkylated DNA nucleotide flippase Atl1